MSLSAAQQSCHIGDDWPLENSAALKQVSAHQRFGPHCGLVH